MVQAAAVLRYDQLHGPSEGAVGYMGFVVDHLAL
jgi:hypothetical protein